MRRAEIEIAARIVASRLGLPRRLRSSSLPALLESLTPSQSSSASVGDDRLWQLISAAELFVSRLRYVPNTCLYRSLARYAILRRHGHDVRFVMGLRHDGDDVTGHAWLERDGRPLRESVDPRLVVTYSYPPAGPGGRIPTEAT
jgi:hypothetical protein